MAEAEAAAAARSIDAARAAAQSDEASRAAAAGRRGAARRRRDAEERLSALERRARAAEDTAAAELARAAPRPARLAAEEAAGRPGAARWPSPPASPERSGTRILSRSARGPPVVFGSDGSGVFVGANHSTNHSTSVSLDVAFDAVASAGSLGAFGPFVAGSGGDGGAAVAGGETGRRRVASFFRPSRRLRRLRSAAVSLFRSSGAIPAFVRDEPESTSLVRERVAFDAMQAPGSKRKAVEAADDEAAAAAEKSESLPAEPSGSFAAKETPAPPRAADDETFTFDPAPRTPGGYSLFSVDLFAESPAPFVVDPQATRRAARAQGRRRRLARRRAASGGAARPPPPPRRSATRRTDPSPGSVAAATPRSRYRVRPRRQKQSTPQSARTDGGASLFSVNLGLDAPEMDEFALSATSPLAAQPQPWDADGVARRMRARVTASRALRAMRRVVKDEKGLRAQQKALADNHETSRLIRGVRAQQNALADEHDARRLKRASMRAFKRARLPEALVESLKRWATFAARAATLRRVFSGCFARAEAARAEDEAQFAAFCRGALGSWRAHARDARRAARAWLCDARTPSRAPPDRRARGGDGAPLSWRRAPPGRRRRAPRGGVRRVARAGRTGARSAGASRRTPRGGTRPRTKKRVRPTRARETAFGGRTSGSVHTRAWCAPGAPGGRAATGRAATRLRRKALARFLWPALSAWRAVALAALRDEVLAGCAWTRTPEHAMWRAWRAWALGPASAALARGAPRRASGTARPFPSRDPFPSPRGNVCQKRETLSRRRGEETRPPRGWGRARRAGTVARRRVLGRVALAGWQTVSARRGSAAAERTADPNAGREPGGASDRAAAGPPTSFTPLTLADAEAVLARAERRAPPRAARARIRAAASRGTVAEAVAAAETARGRRGRRFGGFRCAADRRGGPRGVRGGAQSMVLYPRTEVTSRGRQVELDEL